MSVGLLVCAIDGDSYAIPLERVVEVVRMVRITPVPESPAWVLGVVDVRGVVAPVIDLRMRLGRSARSESDPSRDPSARIVLVRAGDGLAGLVPDAVDAVEHVPGSALGSGPADRTGVSAVAAVARMGDRIVPVLDVERLVAVDSDHAAGHTG